MNKEKAGLIDAFAQRHPDAVKNTIRIAGVVGLAGGAVFGGAKLEEKSIQEALADNDRQPICHSGNGKNWNIIRPNENSYDAHLKDWEGPAHGHDHDYFAFDSNGDGNITEEDCGFEPSPTPTKVFTPVPSLTPEITATFMPSPTVIFTPTETKVIPTEVKNTPTEKGPTPAKSSTPAVCATEEDCYCEKVAAGTVAAAILKAQETDTAGEIEAAKIGATAQVEAAKINASAQAKVEGTATPNGLTSYQPEVSELNQVNKSPLKGEVTPAGVLTVATVLVGTGIAAERKVKKHFESKKKS